MSLKLVAFGYFVSELCLFDFFFMLNCVVRSCMSHNWITVKDTHALSVIQEKVTTASTAMAANFGCIRNAVGYND